MDEMPAALEGAAGIFKIFSAVGKPLAERMEFRYAGRCMMQGGDGVGLLLDVIKANTVDGHPFLSLSHCINRNQKHLACTACMDVCPKGVYDPAQKTPPKWNECQNCGLCVSACPSRCIAPSPGNAKRHLLLAEKKGDIVISCGRAEEKAGHEEACLALLPWEFLAYLALGGRLTLNLKPCRDCPHEACLALLEDQLYQLKCFLCEESYGAHVRICLDELPDIREEGVSRRGFFRAMAHGGQKATALVANDLLGDRVDAMIYRRLLALRVRELAQQDESFACRMTLPWLTEKCYGCGICAMLCPHGALEIEAEPDGRRSVYITPHKCTGCGVCRAVCREDGVERLGLMHLPHMDRALLARVNSRSCARCGRAIRPDEGETLCNACRHTRKR